MMYVCFFLVNIHPGTENSVFYYLQSVNNKWTTTSNRWIDDYATPLTIVVADGEVWFAHNEQVRYALKYGKLNPIRFKGQYLGNDTKLQIIRKTVYYIHNAVNGTQCSSKEKSNVSFRMFGLFICAVTSVLLVCLLVIALISLINIFRKSRVKKEIKMIKSAEGSGAVTIATKI